MKHSEECNSELRERVSGSVRLEFCMSCGYYKFTDIECEHKLIPIKFEISNGYQIRLFCPMCYFLKSNSEKASTYDGTNIPIRKLEDFRKNIDTKKNESYSSFDDLVAEMKQIQQDTRNGKTALFEFQYSEYLKSSDWQKRRLVALERDKFTCQICGSKAQAVHHMDYAHIGNEYLFEIVSLCNNCHKGYYHQNKESII